MPKGCDYAMDKLAETAVVKAYGGQALAIPFVDGYSTTALVKKILGGPRRGDDRYRINSCLRTS